MFFFMAHLWRYIKYKYIYFKLPESGIGYHYGLDEKHARLVPERLQ